MNTDVERTDEERMLAAISHAAILTGAIAPVVGLLVYINQKEKSIYAAGQALQALAFQLIAILVMILSWSCWGLFYAASFIPLIANPDQYQSAPPPIFWVGIGSIVCPFIIMGALGVYGLFGALRSWQGADFRYVLIGKTVESRLANSG